VNDGDALLTTILAKPEEDTPRLVYADWLEENYQPARAEFIRADCELAQLPFPNESNECAACGAMPGFGHEPGCRRAHLWKRKQELWRVDAVRLMGQSEDFWARVGIAPEWYHTDRGFLSKIDSTPVPFLSHADRLLWHPRQERACPLTAQPINTIRFSQYENQFGASWHKGNPATGWVGAVVSLAWIGGERFAPKPIAAPVPEMNISTVAQQIWPWVTFDLVPV
jgi:uncharacterized protein (TIGR02996 family)